MPVTTTPIASSDHYATAEALELMKGEKNVASHSNTGTETTTADTDRIDAALSYADRFIDDYLGSVGVSLPLSTVPDSLADIAVQLAWVYLMDPDVYRVTESPDAGPGRELFFAMREAKRRLQHVAMFSLGTATRISVTDGRPSWE